MIILRRYKAADFPPTPLLALLISFIARGITLALRACLILLAVGSLIGALAEERPELFEIYAIELP